MGKATENGGRGRGKYTCWRQNLHGQVANLPELDVVMQLIFSQTSKLNLLPATCAKKFTKKNLL